MTNNPAGLLAVFAFVAAAVGSVPLSVAAFLLARRVRPFSRAVLYAGGIVGVVVAVLVRRGLDCQHALRSATLGLPVALVVSLVVVFGDFSRYNITFLTGVEAAIAWTVVVLVVFLGPTVVAIGVTSLRPRKTQVH